MLQHPGLISFSAGIQVTQLKGLFLFTGEIQNFLNLIGLLLN